MYLRNSSWIILGLCLVKGEVMGKYSPYFRVIAGVLIVAIIVVSLQPCDIAYTRNNESINGEWSEDLHELMLEINTKHRKVSPSTTNIHVYDNTGRYNQEQIYSDVINQEINNSYWLSIDEITADVDYLFYLFQNHYNLYQYFGGDKVFLSAKEDILNACRKEKFISIKKFESILIDNLQFIEDGHFIICGKSHGGYVYPFFYTEVSFKKTENGYATEDGKFVKEILGYEELDDVFKVSIDKCGNIVYYPIVLKQCSDKTQKIGQEIYANDDVLTVIYNDGSTQYLKSNIYKTYNPSYSHPYQIIEEQNIRILRINSFATNSFDDVDFRQLKKDVGDLLNQAVIILDIRNNGGGGSKVSSQLLKWLIGEKNVPKNRIAYDNTTGEKELANYEDIFLENDSLLIILTGKNTASSAEYILDYAYNIENTLVIGENTRGAVLSGSDIINLSNSGINIRLALDDSICIFPEELAMEYHGIYPDIWVQAEDAEDAALAFIYSMMK